MEHGITKWAQSSTITGGGGGESYFCQNCMWMCLLNLENLTFSDTNFSRKFPPICIQFWKESSLSKHPILPKSSAVYNNLLKIHWICIIWLLCLWWKPTNCYTKFREKAPQKAGTYIYHVNVRTRPDQYCVSQKKQALTNVVPSYEFCFGKGIVDFDNLNATTFSYHLPKTQGSFVTKWSYDFKLKLWCKTNFTTLCNCFVCGQSITQLKITSKKKKKMVLI